jgi:hypothetical protein
MFAAEVAVAGVGVIRDRIEVASLQQMPGDQSVTLDAKYEGCNEHMTPRISHRTGRRLVAPVLLVWLLPILAACGVAVSDPGVTGTPTEFVATTTPLPTTPTPDASLLEDGGVRIIEIAYVRLLDEYITPVDSSRILDGAWTKLSVQAGEESLDLPAQPAFADDRVGDFDVFRSASRSPSSPPIRRSCARPLSAA